ncbi:glycoside hydrolase [Delitschia confertaspora ATCC 74209]|uniref:Glycoside hydrolase n=1 Tax=Delitschia confertaspora ATCC 74209 TaxID=1513339 RepID=A0A9P4MSU6_9PLEO|nr:glycoside hydrolase [Delitschia confertaspora ATCC 74209]
MLLISILVAFTAFFHSAVAQRVWAHVIVGNNGAYTKDQWKSDIQLAQKAGIDGFVLNIGTPWAGTIENQVSLAFQASNEVANEFKLFFSFDYEGGSAGPWSAGDVRNILGWYIENYSYAKHPYTAFQNTGKAIVSTFEGSANVGDWTGIKSTYSSRGIYFIPEYTSQNPAWHQARLNIIDGVFSWNMWPEGANDMNTNPASDPDVAWKGVNGQYMMGVSPWFFTDLPQYNKRRLWRGDDLWHQRWEHVYDIKPQFVQIVTWNDFGESHYVGPIFNAGIPNQPNANAHWYVDNMPHDGWRALLPHYIATYKNNGVEPAVTTEKLSYWYRLYSKNAGNSNGVVCNAPWQTTYQPSVCIQDEVFVTALIKTLPATIRVQIGNNAAQDYQATKTGLNHFSKAFNGQGAVSVQIIRNGAAVLTGTGAQISAGPPSSDTRANYNAWVGCAPATQAGAGCT